MKKVKSELNYRIPSWGFCNIDTGVSITGKPSKELCRFCVKKKGVHTCLLHNDALHYDGTFVEKTEGCLMATVGVEIEILDPDVPKVDPKELIRMTIDTYAKQVDSLTAQGYPYPMAVQLSKKYMLGD